MKRTMRFQLLIVSGTLFFAARAHAGEPFAPGWRLPPISQYDQTYCGPRESPFLVRGDLNGDGLADLGAIAEGDLWATSVVVRFGRKKGFGPLLRIKKVDLGARGTALELLKGPREMHGWDDASGSEKKISTRYDALELHYCGKSSVAFIWNKKLKKFEELWTSD